MIDVSSNMIVTNSYHKLLTQSHYQYLQDGFHMQNALSDDLINTKKFSMRKIMQRVSKPSFLCMELKKHVNIFVITQSIIIRVIPTSSSAVPLVDL